MPMYDYLCLTCSTHVERFFKMSTVPANVPCECGAHAQRTFDPQFTLIRPRAALRFDPIVVHRRKLENGDYQYSYPGRADDPVQPGYEKVELQNLAQADRFVKDRNAEEQELRRMQISGERDYWQERSRDRRAQQQVELEKRLGKSHSRIGELVARAVDARREKKYRDLGNKAVNFHIEALSYDHSNRREVRDDSNRKISVVVNGSRG